MQTVKPLAKPRLENYEAIQLQELLDKTALIDKIKAELFREWQQPDCPDWRPIKAKLELLSTAEKVLRRMITDG